LVSSHQSCFGVNVVFDGISQNLPDNMQPFISEGRTFMPVRAIADILGVEADWDGSTSTVYLTSNNTASPANAEPATTSQETTSTTTTRTFSGSGDDVITLTPFDGTYVFRISGNEADRHFSVWARGDRNSLLVNTSSPYTGITYNQHQNTQILEITAVGDWTIEQLPISSMRSISTGQTITGTGDEVLRIASQGESAVIEGNNAERHFSVWARGNRNNLLVNTSNEYSGRVLLRDTYTLLEISAVGDWSITFE